jgi:hypothetical protein
MRLSNIAICDQEIQCLEEGIGALCALFRAPKRCQPENRALNFPYKKP